MVGSAWHLRDHHLCFFSTPFFGERLSAAYACMPICLFVCLFIWRWDKCEKSIGERRSRRVFRKEVVCQIHMVFELVSRRIVVRGVGSLARETTPCSSLDPSNGALSISLQPPPPLSPLYPPFSDPSSSQTPNMSRSLNFPQPPSPPIGSLAGG